MPEILGVSNPTPAYDSALNNRNLPTPPGSMNVQNLADPTRVNRSDNRAEQEDARAGQNAPRFDSNFQNFLARLGGLSEISTIMARLLTGRTETFVSSGMGEGIAEELGQFLSMLKMDKGELLRFLQTQLQGGARFGGAFFALLREALLKGDSESLQGDILQFLKRYSDHSSTEHLERNMLQTLNRMARAIPARTGNELLQLIAQLENGIAAGDRAGNLKLLQAQILPLMADYVARSHDMGTARTLLSLLTLDIARYESGAESALFQSFQMIKNHPSLRDQLGGMDDQTLLLILRNSLFQKAAQNDAFATQLASLTRAALRGAGGPEMQTAFRELLSSFVTNESVYMPLNHHIIPLDYGGKMMFSELWIDPDAEREKRRERPEEERCVRLLLKMDIQSLGFFDLVVSCRGQQVDIRLRAPERLSSLTPLFGESLGRILQENGLTARDVRVETMTKPLAISQVFPALFDRKEGVNVKI